MTYAQIIKHYESALKAAEKLGYTKRAVLYWQHRGIPKRAQRLIQAATRGRLRADTK